MLLRNTFFSSELKVPSLDLSRYLSRGVGWQEDCRKAANSLRDYGAIAIKDPRADFSYNWKFLSLMEKYYELRTKQLEQGMEGREVDIVPHKHQQGLTKPGFERSADFLDIKEMLKPEHKSFTPPVPDRDATITYTWLVDDNHNPLPKEFPEFGHVVSTWGGYQKNVAFTVAEMAALGLGL